MATIKSVMDDACIQCSVPVPTSFATNQTTTYRELKLFLRQTVDELLERVDWPDPINIDYALSGTGMASYVLPADFKRLTYEQQSGSGPVYEETNTRRFAVPVAGNSAWTALLDQGSAAGNRYYRLTGDEDAGYELEFYREPQTGETINVSYISKNWKRAAGGGVTGDTWTADDDTLLLPQRLVFLGVVCRWRQKKGLPYADLSAEYEANLARRANNARQIKVICYGDQDQPLPMRVPVPDYIPPA